MHPLLLRKQDDRQYQSKTDKIDMRLLVLDSQQRDSSHQSGNLFASARLFLMPKSPPLFPEDDHYFALLDGLKQRIRSAQVKDEREADGE